MITNYTKTVIASSLAALFLFNSSLVHAEPRTVPTSINSIRSLANGSILVTIADRTLSNPTAGSLASDVCTNSSFLIEAGSPGTNMLAANVLTALAAGLEIQVEIPSSTTVCGFGTPIQSIFIVQ